MATKMKSVGWFERDRQSRLANVMYPNLAPPEVQRQMLETAAVEGKQDQVAKRIEEGNKGYGKAKSSVPEGPYDRVPGLKRVQPEAPAARPWWSK